MSKEIGIKAKKKEDFSEWYSEVIIKSELADYGSVKGFMVLRPYGFQIWEIIKETFDKWIKRLNHKNAYFPSLIPQSLLMKEREHFKGFNPEVFWVTHAGNDELSEKLAIRPTSETIIYDSYAKWVRSWRDLPLLINVWNSVLRAEIKSTKPFIRTSEFLWQEGHTVHESKKDADKEVRRIIKLYKRLIEDYLAIPTIIGKKSEKEKFVGALYTITLESLMPDGRALQMGTSHNLGQNFSKPFEIKFLGRDGKEHYAWTASWGFSWRLLGALVMVHGDDKGLIIPPKVAPIQVIIIPIFYKKEKEKIIQKVKDLKKKLKRAKVRVEFDLREGYTPGWKYNEWELKGVPLRIEIGPRDLANEQAVIVRRDNSEKRMVKEELLVRSVKEALDSIQKDLFKRAKGWLDENTFEVKSFGEFEEKIEKGALIKAPWCLNQECEIAIKEKSGADIRLIPLVRKRPNENCMVCEKPAKVFAYFARAY